MMSCQRNAGVLVLLELQNVVLVDEQRIGDLKEDSTPDDNLFADLVGLFESSVKNSLEKLNEASVVVDHNAMRAAAHKIRNTSGNVGAKRMHSLATQFELGCASFDKQQIVEWLAAMQTTYTTSLTGLREKL